MNKLKNKFLHAFVGIWYTIYTQSSFRIQIVFCAFLVGLWLIWPDPVRMSTGAIFIALILSGELANTVVERICDYIQPELDPRIKIIKDVSAGAVFMVCIIALIWALICYVPLFWEAIF